MDKLVGANVDDSDKDYEDLVKEWLQEERDLAPQVSEDQRKLLESIPKVSISDDRLKELCRLWKDALILNLMGKPSNLNMIRDRVAWLLKSDNFDLVDLPDGYYVFKSTDITLGKKLLFDGPWTIQGHYLAAQRWSPNFNPYCDTTKKVAVWVRIPTLPIHMYSKQFMMDFGNLIGKALKVDINTLAQRENQANEVARAKFARVSVEVDLSKKLQSRFQVRSKVYPVEYEGLSAICIKCGMYGHNQDTCPTAATTRPPTTDTADAGEDVQMVHSPEKMRRPLVSIPGINIEEEYGDWMKVKPFTKRRNPKSDAASSQQKIPVNRPDPQVSNQVSGSRFDILATEEPNFIFNASTTETTKRSTEKKWKKKESRDSFLNHDSQSQSTSKKESRNMFDLSQGRRVVQENVPKMGSKATQSEDIPLAPRRPRRNNRKDHTVNDPRNEEGNGGNPSASVVGPSTKPSPSRGLNLGKKRASTTRPKPPSPLVRKKRHERAHQVTFGAIANQGPLDYNSIRMD